MRRNISQPHRHVIGSQVEPCESILEIEIRGAVLVVQHALLDRDMARLEIEKRIEHWLARLASA